MSCTHYLAFNESATCFTSERQQFSSFQCKLSRLLLVSKVHTKAQHLALAVTQLQQPDATHICSMADLTANKRSLCTRRQRHHTRGGYSTYFTKSKSVHTLKGLALPRACHSGKIALAGSRRLRSMLVAAPVLFAHAVVTEIKTSRKTSPTPHHIPTLQRRCCLHLGLKKPVLKISATRLGAVP